MIAARQFPDPRSRRSTPTFHQPRARLPPSRRSAWGSAGASPSRIKSSPVGPRVKLCSRRDLRLKSIPMGDGPRPQGIDLFRGRDRRRVALAHAPRIQLLRANPLGIFPGALSRSRSDSII